MRSASGIARRPFAMRLDAGDWLGDCGLVDAAADDLRIFPPASASEIGELERRTNSRLPESFREFLAVSDGMDVGPVRVLGSADAYQLDIPARDGLVIAWEPDELDDHVIVVPRTEGDATVYRVACASLGHFLDRA